MFSARFEIQSRRALILYSWIVCGIENDEWSTIRSLYIVHSAISYYSVSCYLTLAIAHWYDIILSRLASNIPQTHKHTHSHLHIP
jgi:hypothetical protein